MAAQQCVAHCLKVPNGHVGVTAAAAAAAASVGVVRVAAVVLVVAVSMVVARDAVGAVVVVGCSSTVQYALLLSLIHWLLQKRYPRL